MNPNDRAALIDKIKKCLALATSSNEHEAAIALRQARKLMQAHGISDLDIAHADIQEQRTKAGAAQKPARWECGLASRIARAFDCQVIFEGAFVKTGQWNFIGATPSGEITRYAFEVLFRQIKRARAHYIKTTLKRCTTTRTRRADLFCEGWVMTATELVENMTGNAATQARIAAYLEHNKTLETFQGRNRNQGRHLTERDHHDLLAGREAGQHAQLHHAVATTAPRPLEHLR